MKELFKKRLNSLYTNWVSHKHDLWANSDVIIIHSNNTNPLSSQFYIWLIGEQLHDTTVVFSTRGISFFCDHTNFSKIRSLCCFASLVQKLPVSVQLKAKNDDGFVLIDTAIRNARGIREAFGGDDDCVGPPFVVGYVDGEYPKTRFLLNCVNELEPMKYRCVAVNSGVDKLIRSDHNPVLGVGSEKELCPLAGSSEAKRCLKSRIEAKFSLKSREGESNLWSGEGDELFVPFLEKGDQSAVAVNSGVDKLIKSDHNPVLGVEYEKELCPLAGSIEAKRCLKSRIEARCSLKSREGESSLWSGEGDELFVPFLEKGDQSTVVVPRFEESRALWEEVKKGNLESKFGRKGLRERRRSSFRDKDRGDSSNLTSRVEDGNVWPLMKNSDLSYSSTSGKQDSCGDQLLSFGGYICGVKENVSKEVNKDGDELFKFVGDRLDSKEHGGKEGEETGVQLFKFGAFRVDGKEDKSKEGIKNDDKLSKLRAGRYDGKEKSKEGKTSGDQLFKFGGSWLDGKDVESKEGSRIGDQLFKFGGNRFGGKVDKSMEVNRNCDQLFKFGGSWLDAKEKSEEGNKNGGHCFEFGANRFDGKADKSLEGNKIGDQLFRFGEGLLTAMEDKSKEGSKDGDHLLKFGEGKKDDDKMLNLGGNKRDEIYYRNQLMKKDVKNDNLLKETLAAFYYSWRKYKEEQWGKADVLVINTHSVEPPQTLSTPVSGHFMVWLLHDDFPDTTAVFTDDGIEFLCTKESFSRLRTIGIRITKVMKFPVSVQLKKRGEHCVDWLKKTLCQVRSAKNCGAIRGPLVVGCIKGEFMEEIKAFSHFKMFEIAYVENALTNLLGQRNRENSKCAAGEQPTLLKYFRMLSLKTCSDATTANVSSSELAKIKSVDDQTCLSHTAEEESNLPSKVDETRMFEKDNKPSKLEEKKAFEQDRQPSKSEEGNVPSKIDENQLFEEDKSARKPAGKNMLLEEKESGDQLFKLGGDEQHNICHQPQLMKEDVKNANPLRETITAFYSSWSKYKEEQWGKADVLVINTHTVGPLHTLSIPVSSSFLVWLLEDDFPDTTAVFTDAGIDFLCTKESFSRLRAIGIRITAAANITVSVQLKKGGEHCVDWLKETLYQVRSAKESGAIRCPLVVGCIKGESMEIEALLHSKMFEIAYVDSALTNLLEQRNLENTFQTWSLKTCSETKTAKVDDSPRELEESKIFEEDNVPSKLEDDKLLEEDCLARELAEKATLLEKKEGDDMKTSIIEDEAEEAPLVEEKTVLHNPEKSKLLQEKECMEQSKLTAEGRMDYGVQLTGLTGATSENSLRDSLDGILKEDSIVSDHEDDEWTLTDYGVQQTGLTDATLENSSRDDLDSILRKDSIVSDCEDDEWTLIEASERQVTEVPEKLSWKRWFVDKNSKSFGRQGNLSGEEASSKEE